MKNQGEGVIRLGDKTSHGSEVTSALDGLNALEKRVADEGRITWCAQCKGLFALCVQVIGKSLVTTNRKQSQSSA